MRSLFPFADLLQGELPRSSLQMLQPSSPRPLLRVRIYINHRSLALNQPAFEAGKPTSAYVFSESRSPLPDRNLGLEARLGNFNSADMLQGSKVIFALAMLTPQHLTARSSAHDAARDLFICNWPATLRELHISGGIHDGPLMSLTTLPPSLSRLSIENCPHLSMVSIGSILRNKGSQLHHLEIVAPIPALTYDHKPLSGYMEHVPNLLYLKISLDFVSRSFLLSDNDKGEQYPLRQLDLDCFDPADCDTFTAYDVWAAIAYDSRFGRVRKVRVHRRLGWAATKEGKEQVKDLDDLLKALAREDGANAEIQEADAGVVLFGKR